MITQCTTFPVLFCYRFKKSRNSALASLCPTSDPYTTLYNILIDAKQNFQVNQISIDKNVVVVHSDGSEEDVSKWLKPSRENNRTDRPAFKVTETDEQLFISLHDRNDLEDFEESVLEDSIQKLSIGPVEQNTSISSIHYEPRYVIYVFH